MQTCRASTGTSSGAPFRRSETFQPLSVSSQSIHAPTASGSDFSIGPIATLRMPYGSGTGRAMTEGWTASWLRLQARGLRPQTTLAAPGPWACSLRAAPQGSR